MCYLVLMCYAHGYGKFGNYPTMGYITVCHISGGGYWPQICKFESKDYATTKNINYFGCDYKVCYSSCVMVLPFEVLLLKG